MKRILVINAFLIFLLSGNSFASPITLTNVLNFKINGVVSSGNGSGELIRYSSGTVNQLDGSADYAIWSQTLSFNPQAQTVPDTLNGVLSLRLRNEDSSLLPDIPLSITDQSTTVRTDSYSYNVYLDNGSLVVTLLSLNKRFFIDSSALSISYDPISERIPAPVPEPASLLLFGIAISMSGILIRKKLA